MFIDYTSVCAGMFWIQNFLGSLVMVTVCISVINR